jgi:hypothetical protein
MKFLFTNIFADQTSIYISLLSRLLLAIKTAEANIPSAVWQSAIQQTHGFAPPPRDGFAFSRLNTQRFYDNYPPNVKNMQVFLPN